jgi:hypothetical protein
MTVESPGKEVDEAGARSGDGAGRMWWCDGDRACPARCDEDGSDGADGQR